jgi:hypothetical protein
MMYPDSMTRGIKAEDRFVQMAEDRGLIATATSRKDNIFAHADFLVVEGPQDRGFMVDVKARKRITRGDQQAQDEEIWLELKNVRGNEGWVYSEGFCAFEISGGFLLVPKFKLASLIQEKVSTQQVHTAKEALYNLYTRRGRQDLLTRVKFSDIKAIATEVWD